MAAGRVLLRVRSHSGPCLDLLQSGIVRTFCSPFKGASRSSTSSQLCGCDFHLPLQTSDRELPYLRSVRATKDIHRGIDSAIHLGLAKLTVSFAS